MEAHTPEGRQEDYGAVEVQGRSTKRTPFHGDRTATSPSIRNLALVGVGVIVTGATLGSLGGAHFAFSGSMAANEPVAEDHSVSFALSNGYPRPGSLKFYTEWPHIVEPWKNTTISASGIDADSTLEWKVTYSMQGTEHSIQLSSSDDANRVVALFPHAGQWYDITLVQRRIDGSLHQAHTRAIGKYVRREIRTLNPADRERYLNALEQIHRLDLKEGQRRYGAKFVDQQAFLVKHLAKDSLTNCNFFHGCAGFLTGHAAFNLELEQALQAIDPSLAATYWDPSVDDAVYGEDWYEQSPVIASDWLGPLYGNPNNSYIIDEGRWAYVSIPTDRTHGEHNAYGRLTQTYNNDGSAYVWRSDSVCGLPSRARLPGCTALKGILSYGSLDGLRAKIETDWHGTLHPVMGGAYQCPYGMDTLLEKHPDWGQLLEFIAMLLEVTWDVAHDLNYLVCPTFCADEAGFEDCACACPKHGLHDMNASVAYEFLDSLGLLDRYYGCQRGALFMNYTTPPWDPEFIDPVASALESAGAPVSGPTGKMYLFKKNATALLSAEEQAELMVWLAQATCHPGRVSPFMTPLAAPNDPLFWASHGSFEKIWAAKRILPEYKDSFDQSWDYTGGSTCYGRNWNDTVPFRDFLNEELHGLDPAAYYTQKQLYELFDPFNERLPYMFDDYEWRHCKAS